MKEKNWYRFRDGSFVKAKTFAAAKARKIAEIEAEEERPDGWHACTCLGFQHQPGCPEMDGVIPF